MSMDPTPIDLGPCQAMLHRPDAPTRVVILPGAYYSIQAPLLWFAQEIALAHGAGVLAVVDRWAETDDPFEWAKDRARRALDVRPAEHHVVVGKSVASAAAGLVAERGLPALWLTPLLDQQIVLDGLVRASASTLLIGGTADPTWKPEALGQSRWVEVSELADANHSLQRQGQPRASAEMLRGVVATMDTYVGTCIRP